MEEPRQREYELLYIIPATFTDEEVAPIEANVKAILEKYTATIVSTSRLGKLRFAYPIKKVRHGHYILVRFTADTLHVAKIEEALRITNDVLRHLIVRADEVGAAKFEMVQFTEVNLDLKDDRPRHRTPTPEVKPVEKVAAKVEEAPKEEISPEELEKKIDSALTSL